MPIFSKIRAPPRVRPRFYCKSPVTYFFLEASSYKDKVLIPAGPRLYMFMYGYEQTSASAELFWLTVTVGTGVHGKLKKPTATGRLPSVVFGTRFARRRRKILKILCTILKRTYIILDVQIALKMKKKRHERVAKNVIFFRGA